jgi:glucosamine-6-phosphate deaminase
MNESIDVQYFNNDLNVYLHAAKLIKNEFDAQSKTIGFATGGTMIPLYRLLKDKPIDFSNVVSFNLDEYVGLAPYHPSNYHEFMNDQIYQYKRFKKSYIPDGNAIDLQVEIDNYEILVQESKLDLQILGVGVNGHIGFNEPGTSFSSKTHLVELSASTRKENAKYFLNNYVPYFAITMGIQTILSAKQILLIAMGEKKRAPLEALLSGVIDEACPITALNLHKNVKVLTNLIL